MNNARSASEMDFDERMGLFEREQYHSTFVSFDNEIFPDDGTMTESVFSSDLGDDENISAFFEWTKSETQMLLMGAAKPDGLFRFHSPFYWLVEHITVQEKRYFLSIWL
jgi:hypothetical protein